MKIIATSCFALFVSCLPLSAEVKLSDRLAKIAVHLGEGGAHFSVTDSEDDLKDLAVILDQVFAVIPELALPPGLKVESLFEDLGLYALQGSGQSSHQLEELWHNRSFFLTDGKHDGLLSLLGAGAGATVAPEFAPAGADLVLETSLDLRQVKAMADKISAMVGPEATGEVDSIFAEALGAGGLTLSALFEDLAVRGTLVFWLDEARTFSMGPEGAYPVPHLAGRLDNAAILWSLILAEFGEMGELVEEGGEVTLIPEDAEIESPFGPLTPRLVWSPKTKSLFFGMTEEDLALCRGEGARLATDREFQRATEGFPEKTSGLAYLSRDFLETALAVGKEFSGELPPEAGEVVEALTPYAETWSRKGGYAGAFAVEESGFLSVANLARPIKGGGAMTGLGGISAIGMIAGMTTPLVLKAEARADEMKLANALKVYAMAQNLYRDEKGRYAKGLDELVDGKFMDVVPPVLEEADFEVVVWEREQKGVVWATTIIGKASSRNDPDMVLVARADGSVTTIPRQQMRAQLRMQREEK